MNALSNLDLEGKGGEGTRCYYGQVVEDLEKEDNVSGEDGGKVGEKRWNSGMDIHPIISLSDMREDL